MLPNDVCRCDNEDCPRKDTCRRYLDVLPDGLYSWCAFPGEPDCEFFVR